MMQDEPQPDKYTAEERALLLRKQDRINRKKPVKFVLGTLAAWWLVSVLADLVVTCVPGAPACGAYPMTVKLITVVRSLRNLDPIPVAAMSGPGEMDAGHWIILLCSLVAALWIAKVAIYPNREFGQELADAEAELAREKTRAGPRWDTPPLVWFEKSSRRPGKSVSRACLLHP